VAAAELAGIPVTYRGVASGFLVLSGHAGQLSDDGPLEETPLEEAVRGVVPGSVTLVVMMGLDVRDEIVASLTAHGWQGQTPAAILCGASTPDAWTWIGTLRQLPSAAPPPGVPGVLVIGEVIRVRQADQGADGVKYGSH
jgi:siroheme synthase